LTRKQQKKIARRKTEAERQWEKIRRKYPNCSGSYPECPPEIEDKNNPPGECRLCPVYFEWKK
jgi:hypothetical protein